MREPAARTPLATVHERRVAARVLISAERGLVIADNALSILHMG